MLTHLIGGDAIHSHTQYWYILVRNLVDHTPVLYHNTKQVCDPYQQ